MRGVGRHQRSAALPGGHHLVPTTPEGLDRALSSIHKIMVPGSALETAVKPRMDELRARFNYAGVSRCLETFIAAEMDCTTPGDRGMGRMTAVIPRFGAYHRKGISELSGNDRQELATLLHELMLRAYVASYLFVKPTRQESPPVDDEALLKQWVLSMYAGSGLSDLSEGTQKAVSACIDGPLSAILSFLEQRGIRGGGFFSRDRTGDIVFGIAMAGFALRPVQVGGMLWDPYE